MTAIRLVKSKMGPRLTLKGKIAIGSAQKLRQTALDAARLGSNVVADVSAVEHLDCSALQILVALRMALRDHGNDLQLTGASDSLKQTLRIVGFLENR